MRYKIIPIQKPTTESDLRLARMSKDGFTDLGDLISAVETSYPNARYITSYSTLEYFISRGWKPNIHVIRPDGDSPETRQFSVVLDSSKPTKWGFPWRFPFVRGLIHEKERPTDRTHLSVIYN